MPERPTEERIPVWLTREEAMRVFYELSNIRDCNLLNPEEIDAIETINHAIAEQLRESGVER